MNDLLGTLGLGKVEADPNNLPEGRYEGTVTRSQMVLVKSKKEIAHAISYTVESGQFKGATRQEFFTYGTTDSETADERPLKNYEATMGETRKSWYKKRLVDLGISQAKVDSGDFEVKDLVGTKVVFGVKHSGQYINVSFAEKRNTTAGAVPLSTEPVATTGDPFEGAQPETPTANAEDNLEDL